MCIGLPLQVLRIDGRHAECVGRDERRRIDLALVGEVRPGDWLLVFLDAARECISAERAAEVQAALDLVTAALGGHAPAVDADPGFPLPSTLDARALAALTGQT